MRKALSISLMACLMLISAFANFGTGYAKPVEDTFLAAQIVSERPVQDKNAFLPDSLFIGLQGDVESDECPCKKETSKTKFVCGVALALLHNAATLYPPVPRKPRFAIYQTTFAKSHIDLLKRPPRTHL